MPKPASLPHPSPHAFPGPCQAAPSAASQPCASPVQALQRQALGKLLSPTPALQKQALGKLLCQAEIWVGAPHLVCSTCNSLVFFSLSEVRAAYLSQMPGCFDTGLKML